VQQQATQANFTSLQSSVNAFAQAGVTIDSLSLCLSTNSCVSAVDVNALNARLRYTERRMLVSALTNNSVGLPQRPWFKHVVQAPGIYQGYGSQVFPGIEQGIIDEDNEEIQQQINIAAATIANAAQALTELSVTATPTPNKCYGQSLGALSLTSQGGFTPVRYYYSVNHTTPPPSSSLSFFNLSSALYVVYAIDAQNITANFSVNVTQPAKLILTVTRKDKQASVQVSGGVGNYSIVWSNGHNTSSTQLTSYGTYNVTVTDSNGCTADSTYSYTNKELSGSAIAGISVIAAAIVVGTLALVFYYLKNRNKEKYAML